MVYSYALGKAQTIITRSTSSFKSSPQRCRWNGSSGRLQKLRVLVYDILRCRKAVLGMWVVWWPLPSFQRQSPRASSLHAASLLQTIARHTLGFMSVHALLCVVCFCHTGKLKAKHSIVYIGTPRKHKLAWKRRHFANSLLPFTGLVWFFYQYICNKSIYFY